MNIAEHVSLKNLTTFKIGGNARFFVAVKSIEELQEAVSFARSQQLSIFILGGGSNVLMSDNGFLGLVIKIEIMGIERVEKSSETYELIAGAGEEWDGFVEYAVKEGLHGLENLSYIPGNVGAAPVQNIGAYGSEVKDTLLWVEALNNETGQLQKFSNEQCQFAYRDSFFKKSEGKKYTIVRVAFLLSKKGTLNTHYKDITEYIKSNVVTDISLRSVRDIVVSIRKAKLPDVKEVGTAGSFFKNPIISKAQYEKLLIKYPELPSYPMKTTIEYATGDNIKVPAAWILDTVCGFKGFREGEVGVYKNQALVLVNFGNAKAQNIIELAEKMIACVKEKTEIELEKEVQIIL